MTDAGDAELAKIAFTQSDVDATSYSKSAATGSAITNRFNDVSIEYYDPDFKYVSRGDWTGTLVSSANYKDKSWTAPDGFISDLKWNRSDAVINDTSLSAPVLDSKSTAYKVTDLIGVDYNDKKWEELVSQLSWSDISKLVRIGGYSTLPIESIGLPATTDKDGPSGFSGTLVGGVSSMAWPAEVVMASTWNSELIERMGELIGDASIITGTAGWYAPGIDIHRSPYSGRNFEYFSEDGLLSGKIGAAEMRGVRSKGVMAYMKHFALNDQEDHRAENGLATWSNEQAIREIYLQPFRVCVERRAEVETRYWEYNEKDGSFTEKKVKIPGVLAIMSSFNRIGATWAGGDYRLLTQVLRNEWGFDGMVLTDYDNGGYMNTQQCLRAGGDVKLTQQNTVPYSIKTDADKYYARESMKHVLYTVVNSNAMNGYIHGVKVGAEPFAYYYLILIAVGVLAAGFTAWAATIAVLKWRRELREGKGESAEAPAPQNTEDAPAPEDKE